MHNVNESDVCLCDFTGQVGWYIDGFDGVCGVYLCKSDKLQRGMLLEFCLEKELCVKYMA